MSVPGRERSGNPFAWIPTTKILMIQCRIESKPTARGAEIVLLTSMFIDDWSLKREFAITALTSHRNSLWVD
ncbi:hypothetical protein Y35_GM000127 [Pseudomonas phage YS35]|uniref:Uncharacterized protein n=3 Tax=Pakpunavirus TaxID=1921407 RepID=A0A291LAV3_9CAUD|nr:hypothetical protein QE343_gp130 [Pseudomonas phage YS35]ATI16100.1 hypothetical protein Y35_GM000127 [Pseudomonas phage YS35]